MARGPVAVPDLQAFFDDLFALRDHPPDMPFSQLVPRCYADTGRDAEALFEPSFFPACNGLMHRGGGHVGSAAMGVFMSDELVASVVGAGLTDCLLFTHHPLDMETSDRGFLPLSPSSIDALRAARLSVYTVHNPLDRNATINTSLSLARLIGMTDLAPFTPDGVEGRLPEAESITAFAARLAGLLKIPSANTVDASRPVQRIALLPGGGSNIRMLRLALDRKVDTYVTGTYFNQIRNETGERHRRELRGFLVERPPLNLVEGSHYATEAPVLFTDIAELIRSKFGLRVRCFPQTDPWH
jgi:putative NIF3 family GTP cyclohydrolase 1 type 2